VGWYFYQAPNDWHKAWLNKENIQAVCLAEIKEYTKDMNNENH
jgi:CDP-glucose 4,6-dehydratase